MNRYALEPGSSFESAGWRWHCLECEYATPDGPEVTFAAPELEAHDAWHGSQPTEARKSADVGPPAPTTLGSKWTRTGWGLTVFSALAVLLLASTPWLIVGSHHRAPNFVLNWVVFLCIIVGVLTLWLGSLIEALRAPDWLWARASQSKPTFVVLIVLLLLLGSVLYLTIARPALYRASQEGSGSIPGVTYL